MLIIAAKKSLAAGKAVSACDEVRARASALLRNPPADLGRNTVVQQGSPPGRRGGCQGFVRGETLRSSRIFLSLGFCETILFIG